MKSAIVYLSHNKDINNLNRSIDLVRKNLPHEEILVFYEHDDIAMKDYLSTQDVRSESVQFSIPDYVDLSRVSEKYNVFSIGYRHMCRFFSGGIFENLVIQEYDFILRLDSDSFIHRKADSPIDYCYKNGIHYGYLTIGKDDPNYTREFKNTSLEFCNNEKVSSYNDHYYYTNFEVINLEKVWNETYKSYFSHLDYNGGIYYYRWGDTIIRYLGLQISMDSRFIKKLSVPYKHQDFYIG